MTRLTPLFATLLLAACGPQLTPWGDGVVRPLASRGDELERARAAAERDGSTFFVAYDPAGAPAASWAEQLRRTWRDDAKALQSPAWARENGRAVVVLEGLGEPDRPGTVAEAMDLVDWLKAEGCYVVGRVPRGWRTGVGTSPNFLAVFLRLDAVAPADQAQAEALDDAAWARERGVAYVPAASLAGVRSVAR